MTEVSVERRTFPSHYQLAVKTRPRVHSPSEADSYTVSQEITMEPKRSLPYSQQPNVCPCNEPIEWSASHAILFLLRFILILSSHIWRGNGGMEEIA